MQKLKVEINTDNIVYNFKKIRNRTGYGVDVIPTLKANAYNIGFYTVIDKLLKIDNPQKKIFVFSLKEAIELRILFPSLEKIFVFSGVLKDDAKFFKKYNLTPVINDYEQLQIAYNQEIEEIVLQFNTGMNRSGIELNEMQKVKNYIKNSNLKIIMIMSHFCCANSENDSINSLQIENFREIIKYFPNKNILRGLSASDGIVNFDLGDLCNTCRPGLALYGYYSGLKPVYSIYSHIESDKNNLYLPLGILNGFTSDYGSGNSYILCNNEKIFISSIENNKIILNSRNKKLIGKTAIILGNGISLRDFEIMSGIDIRDIVARVIANCDINHEEFKINTDRKRILKDDSNFKIKAIMQDNKLKEFTTTIMEKRIIKEDGVVGYNATENVKKGEKLATFFGGYLDGIHISISNKKCKVFVEDKNKKLVECEIFGRISMDQTVIKIKNKDFSNIKIGAKVIIFDSQHPIERFELATGKTKEELFFYVDKSSRVKINRY